MLVGEYEEAVTVLNLAIKKHHRAELFYQLSNCFFNLKDQDKGMECASESIGSDPSLAKDMQKKYPFIKDEVKKVKASKVKKKS
jgi:hypothetical protein